jgi:UDP-2,3-diacylglucosamine pyrophosphatase LpxH
MLRNGALLLTGATLPVANWDALLASEPSPKDVARGAMITDLHFADKPPAGSRHYRETLDKLAEASEKIAATKPQFVVELGDFIDAADDVETEKKYLREVNEAFTKIPGDKHYVLGNHCVYSLNKSEFLEGVGKPKSYYSFDVNGVHFIVLDSCFRSDGEPYGRKNFVWTDPNIPADEVDWLKQDLATNTRKTVVFAHQRLDVGSPYGVKNAAEIRTIFEESGNVVAVFQGHSHHNEYKDINGVHYCTLVAMVEGAGLENNGYSTLEVAASGDIRVQGFRKQSSRTWAGANSG